MFDIVPLVNLTDAEEACYRTRGLPGHPFLVGPEGQFFGHEWSRWLYDTLDRRLDDRLATEFWPGASILDLGCATGAKAARFAKDGHRVTAVDVVDHAEEIAARNQAVERDSSLTSLTHPIVFVQADLRHLPDEVLVSGFDVVHIRRVIPFIPPENLADTLGRACARVRSGGLFVASFISTESSPDAMRLLPSSGSLEVLALRPGLYAYTFGDIHRALGSAGLTVLEAFTDAAVEVGLIAIKAPVD